MGKLIKAAVLENDVTFHIPKTSLRELWCIAEVKETSAHMRNVTYLKKYARRELIVFQWFSFVFLAPPGLSQFSPVSATDRTFSLN